MRMPSWGGGIKKSVVFGEHEREDEKTSVTCRERG